MTTEPRPRARRARPILAALLGVVLLASPALAQPADRPLRIVAGFAPGGTSDIVARVVAEAVAAPLGQRPVVENRTGANGFIAAEAVVRGPATAPPCCNVRWAT